MKFRERENKLKSENSSFESQLKEALARIAKLEVEVKENDEKHKKKEEELLSR